MTYRSYDELRRGLVLHLPFSEGIGTKVFDTSQSRLNGIITGADWVEGREGRHALNFDPGAGSADREYVTIIDPDGLLNTITDAGTWAFWIKCSELTEVGVLNHYFINKNNAFKALYKDSTQKLWLDFDYGGGSVESINTNYTIGLATPADHHISITYSKIDELIILYIDSVLYKTYSFNETLDTSAQNLYIGGTVGTDRTIKSIMDDFRIYDRTLDAIEIRNLYNLRGLI